MSDLVVPPSSENRPVVAPGGQPPLRDRVPRSRHALRTWLRRNLFRGPVDGAVTIVVGAVALWALYRVVRFVLVTGRWEVVRVNLKLLMVGRYPVAELDRLAVGLALAALVGGLVAGVVHRSQVRAGTSAVAGQAVGRRLSGLFGRVWPLVLATLLLLGLTDGTGPWITVGLALLGALVGRVVGGRLPRRADVVVVAVAVLTPFVLVWYLAGAAGWDDWGGMMLNVFIAVVAILLSFPLGVLLALGRRSGLPVISGVATVFIELVRGAPLFVLLLMANVALGFFIPPEVAPGRTVRAIVVFTIFTAAYVAEIVRGGLQSLPPGQAEAGRALGLPAWRVTGWIVLPQALRNVIPAQVGQFISLFKDTTLAGAAMGLFEMLTVAEAVTQQGAFAGQRLTPEIFAFVALLFWVGSYTLSRESQRLESKLGVGHR